MQRFPFTAPTLAAIALLAVSGLTAGAQQQPAGAGTAATPVQTATAASLNDVLLTKAATLYSSTAKSGLESFNCQVHPDWNKMMMSERKGAPAAADNSKVALLSAVKITLRARLKGESVLDWHAPAAQKKQLDQASTEMLERAHRSIDSTWQGLLKLWIPLVDGSLAERLGEEGAQISETADGYLLRSKDGARGRSELFDRNMLLKNFTVTEAEGTVSLTPAFQATAEGLLLSGFDARVQAAGAPEESARPMHVAIEYQTVAGFEIPGKVSVETPGAVEMDFALDGCAVNPK